MLGGGNPVSMEQILEATQQSVAEQLERASMAREECYSAVAEIEAAQKAVEGEDSKEVTAANGGDTTGEITPTVIESPLPVDSPTVVLSPSAGTNPRHVSSALQHTQSTSQDDKQPAGPKHTIQCKVRTAAKSAPAKPCTGESGGKKNKENQDPNMAAKVPKASKVKTPLNELNTSEEAPPGRNNAAAKRKRATVAEPAADSRASTVSRKKSDKAKPANNNTVEEQEFEGGWTEQSLKKKLHSAPCTHVCKDFSIGPTIELQNGLFLLDWGFRCTALLGSVQKLTKQL